MLPQILQWVPPEGIKITLTLFLCFLIGVEREEHKLAGKGYAFGGVRTFPLIGLIGYSLALLSGTKFELLALGFAVIAGFMLLSYFHKLGSESAAGMTSELSGLTTYVVGALVYHEHFWIATAMSVASLLLLELKGQLENLAQRVAPLEILTFTQFLLITAVILPILPNQDFGPYLLNPFKAWLAVIAVSTVSYASYVFLRLSKGRGGLLLTAMLGGAYSSTVTTVALAKQAVNEKRPHLVSGATLLASGVMYLRLLALVGLFNARLFALLAPSFLALFLVGVSVGWLWSRRPDSGTAAPVNETSPRNPLELGAAFVFGLLFIVMMVATRLVITHLGDAGVYPLAAVMGVMDVDPFLLGMTQTAGATTPLSLAACGILIAAASNNAAKGFYAYAWADRATGRLSLLLLSGLAVLGLVPLLWM